MKSSWFRIFRSPADADATADATLPDTADAGTDVADAPGEQTEAGPGSEADAPAWPDDWRVQMADGDAKAARLLERYATPDAVGKALLSAQQRIRSGELKLRPGPDATEAQLADWRQQHGIPATAKDYDVPILLDGSYDDLDEFGKASVDALRTTFHELDMPPDHASRIMSVANDVALAQMERQAEDDAKRHEDTEAALRADWGADYSKNVQLNARFLQDRLGEAWQSFVTARTPDGIRLADDVNFNRFINRMARAEGGTVLLAGETGADANVEARIAEIRKIMASDFARYKRDGLDTEYARLLEHKR